MAASSNFQHRRPEGALIVYAVLALVMNLLGNETQREDDTAEGVGVPGVVPVR